MHTTRIKIICFFLCLSVAAYSSLHAQEAVYHSNILSPQLYVAGNPYSYPVVKLNSGDQLELHFDDTDADVKMYYYTFELRNADWSKSILYPFDYIKGFSNARINTYRQSSIALTRYTHYQVVLPDKNCYPSRSGNYLLKIFLNGDTTKLAFTKRVLVVDNKVSMTGEVQQPFNAQRYNTDQKLRIIVQTDSRINALSPQDLTVSVVQNYTWPTALRLNRPTIFRGNYFEYSDESYTAMPAGKEWRWIDMRSLRLMGDRTVRMETGRDKTDVYLKPDGERQQQLYVYYRDLNGKYVIETIENINPLWQSDYAYVHFSFFPPGNKPYEGKSIYVFGELTNYETNDNSRMVFNQEKGAYEKTLFLKQGFYNYTYLTVPDKVQVGQKFSFENTEGNYWGTENTYMILVYYRPFGARADELIGYTNISSLFQQSRQ